jgi:hypothetical protein
MRYYKLTLIAILFLASVLPVSHAQADPGFSLELAPDTLQPSEIAPLRQFVADAEARLPPELKSVVNRKITVRFTKNLDSTTEFQVPTCGPGVSMSSEGGESSKTIQVRGRIQTGFLSSLSTLNEIELNAAMKSEIIKGPARATPYACGHHNLYQLAMATLLHEISHVYDFTFHATPELKAQLDDLCTPQIATEQTTPSAECTDLTSHLRAVSRLPSFMSVVDWDNQSDSRLNYSALRSPDPYEYSKIEEEFAVNMEYFLLDPEFACRRPSEFEYLKDHLSYDPFPERSCQEAQEVQLANDTLGQTGGEKVILDPSRIYQIHYLFASQGPSVASRWGHAMFRIVMCNKARKEVGPNCLNDIDDHIIVSYRANSGDWSVSAWDGLVGKYPSQLFLYRLYPNIVNEYTVDQFRSLVSLPLKLTDVEKSRFVARVTEQYWQYSGKYYFVTNNCATEALHLLKGVYRDYSFQKWNVLTPVGLYEKLSSAGYIDTALLKNEDQAEKHGYHFPSEQNLYVAAFNQIKAVSPADVPVNSFHAYVTGSTAQNRLELYKKLLALDSNKTQKLANPFFILETYIRHAAGNNYMSSIMGNLQNESGKMEQEMNQVLDMSNQALPWNSASQGYGIPLPGDQSSSPAATAHEDEQSAQVKALYADVMSWAEVHLKAQATELASTQSNEKFFLSEILKKPTQPSLSAQPPH